MAYLNEAEQRRLLAWADLGSARLEQVYNAELAELTLLRQIAARPDIDIDEAEVAAAIAPLLVPQIVAAVSQHAGLTVEQIEQATEDALRDVLGGLNDA